MAETDNVTAVAELLIDDGRWEELRRLGLSAPAFFGLSAPALLVRWLEAVVEAGHPCTSREDVDTRAVICVAAIAEGSAGLPDRRAAESMAIAAAAGVEPHPFALHGLGLLAAYEGHYDEELELMSQAVRAAECHTRYTRWTMRAIWLDAHLRVHGYEDSEELIEEVLRECRDHPDTHLTARLCAAGTAIGLHRDLERGLRLLGADVPEQVTATYTGAWLRVHTAIALTDLDPGAGISVAADAARTSDRAGSPYALHGSVVTLAMLAARTGRLDAARRLGAHAEAFPEWQTRANLAWVRADTVAALTDAGIPTPLPPARLARRELFALIAELEATS